MKPIKFKACNALYGAGQKEYLPLPACKVKSREGLVITCWELSFWERLKVYVTGRIWLSVLTFNSPLQPVLISSHTPTLPHDIKQPKAEMAPGPGAPNSN